MAIETTNFADVSISVSPVGVSGGNFGILGFLTKASDNVTNAILPAERSRAYTGLPSVGGDWPADSEVYKAATAFYAQTPTPKDFRVLLSYDTAQRAVLVGGGSESLETLKAFTSHSLAITIDGTDYTSTSLNLSTATTHAEVATLITTAVSGTIVGVVCTYGAYGYTISGNTTGVNGTIGFATGDIAEALGFAQHQGTISQGVAVETQTAALAACVTKGIDFVGLDLHKSMRDQTGKAAGNNTLEIAQWCEANKKIFVNTTNDLATLSSISSVDTASQLKNASLRFSLTTFSKTASQYPSSSVFGRAASVNFSAIDSTITLNLKSMPGITVEDLTPNEYTVLTSKYASAIVKIGSDTNAYTSSRMASGSWLDTTHGLLWLENRCEVDMFNLMYQSTTKIPYTQTGLNMAYEVLDRSLQGAVRNGLCAPGYTNTGEYLPEGYKITAVKLKDVPSSDKGNRAYYGLSFVMVGAGALHEITVSGSFSE